MITYERIEEYKLDLYHFATTPGTISNAEIIYKVREDLNLYAVYLD